MLKAVCPKCHKMIEFKTTITGNLKKDNHCPKCHEELVLFDARFIMLIVIFVVIYIANINAFLALGILIVAFIADIIIFKVPSVTQKLIDNGTFKLHRIEHGFIKNRK